MTLFDGLYLVLILACSPCLLLGGLLVPTLRRQFKRSFLSLPRPLDAKSGPRIWIHAASVGEMGLGLELARRLRRRRPEATCLFTTNRRPALEMAQGQGELVWYKPFDFSWLTKSLVARLQPDLLVLVETELWPNLIGPLKIPILMLNGRMGQKAFRSYRKLDWVYRPMLRKIRLVLAGDRFSQEGFLAFGARSRLVGNLKLGLTEPPPAEQVAEWTRQCGLGGGEFVWVGGSVGPDELPELIPAIRRMSAERPGFRGLLVPRHPEKAAEFVAQLEPAGLEVHRASQGRYPGRGLYLVDRIGVLKTLYALADLVFVGGSFNQRGGQNMIEPVGLGKPTAVGPHTPNFAEAVALLSEGGGLVRLRRGEELADLAAQPEALEQMAQRGLEILAKQQDAWTHSLDCIDEILRPVDWHSGAACGP